MQRNANLNNPPQERETCKYANKGDEEQVLSENSPKQDKENIYDEDKRKHKPEKRQRPKTGRTYKGRNVSGY